ncbi:MAG: RlmE family RNA methyltransferase [Candidatus Makana argininalis]
MFIKKKSYSSKIWLNNHFNDIYFINAKKNKLRSRSWFKLNEIQKKYNIILKGMKVLDLGSSPGGWSKYVYDKIGQNGIIISCDIIPMKPISGVYFILGNINNNVIFQNINKKIGNNKIDLILSDMSPNISGISTIDIPKFINLIKLSLIFCKHFLNKGGNLVVKIFQGNGFEKIFKYIKSKFIYVKIIKPKSSKKKSKEIYIISKGYII